MSGTVTPGGSRAQRLTCKLRSRGRVQLELKLHYPLRPLPHQVFQTEVYVFAPDKLDLTAESYGIRRALAEIVLLLRHSSPRIPLDELLAPGAPLSPLSRLERSAEAGWAGTGPRQVVHELKTLVNTFRAESRTMVEAARRAVSRAEADAVAEVGRARDLVLALPTAARRLRERLERLSPEPEVLRALAWCDEALSAVLVGSLFRLLDALRAHRGLRGEAARVREALEAETEYRRRRGMALEPTGGRSPGAEQHNERVLLRIRALKRWSQSALFLGKRVLRENARVGQFAAGTAAALAMSFAVVAAAFAQEHFAAYSLPWAFIVILSYILKDRIKEIARAVIGAMIPRLLSDRSHALLDSSGAVAGRTRETVGFPRADRLPAEVLALRGRAPSPADHLPEDDVGRESVLYYRKWMRTRSSVLLARNTRLERLTALVRLGVEGWLEEMDEAWSVLRSVDGGKEVRGLARRVYHVHVVTLMREEGSGETPRLDLYRVALTREGIVRTERLGTGEQAAP